MKVTTTICIC